jgi:hypothetical protein
MHSNSNIHYTPCMCYTSHVKLRILHHKNDKFEIIFQDKKANSYRFHEITPVIYLTKSLAVFLEECNQLFKET